MACPAVQTVYVSRAAEDPANFSFNNTSHSFPFHFFPFHDATTAGDRNQINNVQQGMAPVVITILIIVAVSVLITSLAAFFIFNARRRQKISDRMAKEERGVTSLEKVTDPAARFRPQFGQRKPQGIFASILRKLKLSKKPSTPIPRMPEKVIIHRWDAHARDPSDSIECTKNERDLLSCLDAEASPISMSLPFSGLSSGQFRRVSGNSTETQLRHQISTGNLSEKYTRGPPSRPRRPSKALFSVALPSKSAYMDDALNRSKSDPAFRRPPVFTPSSVGMLSTPIPAPTLDFSRFRLGADARVSFSTNGATIPEFVMPDDSSSKMLGTERSFTIRSPGKPL